MADRERAGRDASPTAAVVDPEAARSGGTGAAGRRGYDAARRVVGRKRHAPVDTDGRLVLVAVSPSNLHDSHGGIALLRTSRRPWPFIALCYADLAYARPRVAEATPVRVQLVGPKPRQRGFAVQPRRWVIERTIAWIGRCCLARDHEATPSSAIAIFVLATATMLLRRLAKRRTERVFSSARMNANGLLLREYGCQGLPAPDEIGAALSRVQRAGKRRPANTSTAPAK
jgi:putative transposase